MIEINKSCIKKGPKPLIFVGKSKKLVELSKYLNEYSKKNLDKF